jgi:hypothetical protein
MRVTNRIPAFGVWLLVCWQWSNLLQIGIDSAKIIVIHLFQVFDRHVLADKVTIGKLSGTPAFGAFALSVLKTLPTTIARIPNVV